MSPPHQVPPLPSSEADPLTPGGTNPAPSRQRGVIYTAIGSRFIEEATLSARSARAALPDLGIVLFTDTPPDDSSPFDEVIEIEALRTRPHLNKFVCMSRSPFRETLFLDTDTYVCGDISGLFDLLGRFDIAMTLDRRYYDAFPTGTGLPDCFCEFNQGVVAFRQSAELQAMLQASLDWAEATRVSSGKAPTDQIAMRVALYSSALRIAPLPLEYNCRFHAFGYLNGPVRILHARIPGTRHTEANLQAIARKLNRHTIPRVFIGGKVHLLARRRVRHETHLFARSGSRLFWPSKALATSFVLAAAGKAKRTFRALRLRLAGDSGAQHRP